MPRRVHGFCAINWFISIWLMVSDEVNLDQVPAEQLLGDAAKRETGNRASAEAT